jgi:methionyl aminopeptidase
MAAATDAVADEIRENLRVDDGADADADVDAAAAAAADDDADDPAAATDATGETAAKKKKKKKKKKKSGGGGGGGDGARGSGAAGQTSPPSVPVSILFDDVFPPGEIQRYRDDNLWRETSEEKRELERLNANMYNEVRQCAEVHREVRKHVDAWVQVRPRLESFTLFFSPTPTASVSTFDQTPFN